MFCRSGELHFLVRFSRVDRLVVNCIAYGVEDSNIAQHWEFLVFYLFLHLFWLENTTKTSHSWERRRSGELEALWKYRERDRLQNTSKHTKREMGLEEAN